MKNFDSINDVLDFAIEQEQVAVDFYSELSKNTENKEVKDIFLDFVKEEMGHKIKLQKIKKEGIFNNEVIDNISDLKISDYLEAVKPTPNMTYRDALVVAMQRERAAFKLYISLSNMAPTEALKSTFRSLAAEEAEHKLQFETDYDEYVLREN